MSVESKNKKITVATFLNKKEKKEKITMLTAYDYSTARYIDEAGVDSILVGDSLGMVVLGYETTHNVTMDEMKIFTAAAARGVKNSMLIADMPFMSYHTTIDEALKNAGELIQCGANAVKLEGASDFILSVIKRMVETGIPVVGHLGFTPQYLNTLGGYKVQGKTFENTMLIFEQTKKLAEAGVFAITLEMVPEESAKYITENISVPTIGIGAGRYCDGQVLVCDDILGRYSDFTPKFARKYADLKSVISQAAKSYAQDVATGKFPAEAEVFHLSEEELVRLEGHK